MTQDDARDPVELREAGALLHSLMASGLVSDAIAVAEIAGRTHAYGGRVTADCHLRCLGLSERTYKALRLGGLLAKDRLVTVGDLIDVWADGRLPAMRKVGPRAVSEIEARMVFAGLDLSAHQR